MLNILIWRYVSMITIEQYLKHIDNLKEMGLLSKDFRVVQYKDGCLLGVNGKCEAFEDKPLDFKYYVWWIDGWAFRPDSDARIRATVTFDDDCALELRDAPFFSKFIAPLCFGDNVFRKRK